MKKLLEGIKQSGLTKLGFGGMAVLFAIFGAWNLFSAMLGIFIYINANTIYKHIKDIKI